MPHVAKNAVVQLGEGFGLSASTINTFISRSLKRGDLIQLRRGLYVTADFLAAHRQDVSYSFYLANIIRTPSYVSSWAALQYYNLVTEAIRSVTSVTPKVTRTYETRTENFSYQSISARYFTDFVLVHGTFDFFIATPAKALFDLLYFRTHQFRGVSREQVEALIEDLRIDVDEMKKGERAMFWKMVKSVPRSA